VWWLKVTFAIHTVDLGAGSDRGVPKRFENATVVIMDSRHKKVTFHNAREAIFFER
jgi:16S rRNA G527 N7-methylase RsmG